MLPTPVEAAQDYLRRNREKIETAVASAIQAAVDAQAEDPVAFMSAYLHDLGQQRTSGEMDREGLARTFKSAAVLVSDMAGFTKTTRRLGIVHFASLIIRMRQLCLPILQAHGALFIGNEADNLIVVLPSAPELVNAGAVV